MTRLALGIALLLLPLSACASLDEWLQTPVGTPAETEKPSEVEIATPDGGMVVYTPPAPPAPDETTRGDVLAETAGTVVSVLGGNPALGVVLSGALSALLNRRRRD